MRYRITKRANAEIEAICDYIARDSVDAADRLDEKLRREIAHLADVPGMGHQRKDVSNPRYQFYAVGNYVVAFRIEKGALIVSPVIHRARDFRKLF